MMNTDFEILESEKTKVAIRKHIFENFPGYAVCFFAHGDDSGLTEEDMRNCGRFIEANRLYGFSLDFKFEDKGFCSNPCFGPACDCVTAIFSKVVDVRAK